jgi:cupin 2 domain-containing protein
MNLFTDVPATIPAELTTALLESSHVRIERIVSHGQASPPGFWYDQPQHEWVAVFRGRARMRFEGEPDAQELGPGDFVHIPARRRHRVEWTTPDEPTIWLAVHYEHRP